MATQQIKFVFNGTYYYIEYIGHDYIYPSKMDHLGNYRVVPESDPGVVLFKAWNFGSYRDVMSFDAFLNKVGK